MEAHDPSENMQEKHKGNQICDGEIWEQLLEQNRELFSDCGPFCMNGGCEEGKMTCGKSIPPQMLPTDIIRVDFPKLCEESVLEEGVLDEDTAD